MSGKDMMMTTENATDQPGKAELYGPPPESEYFGYYRKDWIDLCEDLKGNDRTVYGVLRSLVFENRQRNVRNDVRVNLSLDDMCALIPGAGGKPITLGGLRDSLRRLTAVGLVSDPNGKPLTTSSAKKAAEKPLRIQIHDIPCNGYVPTWRNTEDKLKAIQAGWKSNQTEPSKSVGWESNQPGWESNQAGWESNHDPESEQPKRAPYTSSFTPDLSTSSPASSPTTANTGVTQKEGEGESPQKTDKKDTAASIAHRLPGAMNRVQRQKVCTNIARLLVAGWGAQALEQELTSDLNGVRSHYAVYQKRLEEYADLEPVCDKAIPKQASSAIDGCAQCDQNGWITVDDGTPNGIVMRCPHDGHTPAVPEPKPTNGRAAEAHTAFAAIAQRLGAAA